MCLEKCSNRICPTCRCYAHKKCWGKYLQNSTGTHTEVDVDTVIVFTPWNARCPQCRGRINNVKPVTRSDTHLGRTLSIIINYCSFLSMIEEEEYDSREEKFALYSKLLNIMLEHKAIIRANDALSTIWKNKLYRLYTEENWTAANIYHYDLFKEQIKPLEEVGDTG